MNCVFCFHEIAVDDWGWGYDLEGEVINYWHSECLNVYEGVAIA